MISVQEVVQDPDFAAPRPFVIQRSTGQWVAGGFQTTVTEIPQFGPVQQASPKEIAMLPEADRAGSIRSFWATIPLHVTTSSAAIPVTHGEVPQGAVPGTVYTLSEAPSGGHLVFYISGVEQDDTQYVVDGNTLSTMVDTPIDASLYVTWPEIVREQAAAADIIVYPPGGERYRVLSTYRVPGSGYWKALGTRMSAA